MLFYQPYRFWQYQAYLISDHQSLRFFQQEPMGIQKTTSVLEQGICWLDQYFAAQDATLPPLNFSELPPFYAETLQLLQTVKFGHTLTYQQLAQKLGSPKAARAVGSACRHNPLPLFIPCHRVVPSNGKLGNYSLFSPQLKQQLLNHEAQRRL